MTSVIEITDLKKTYQSWLRKERIVALKGINLEVHQGEIFGFLGPNGAGKTTTVKLLLGLLRCDSGSIRVLGGKPGEIRVKQQIGYMPERSALPPYLKLGEMLRLFGGMSGLRGRNLASAVSRVVEVVHLTDSVNRQLETFSKGMLQRASLAQALVADPDLLILDEPAIGLDPIARRQLRELLRQLREQGKTVFLNSHELEVVELICDRFAILHQGRVLAVEHIRVLRDSKQFSVELNRNTREPELLLTKLPVTCEWKPASWQMQMTCTGITELNHVLDEIRKNNVEIVSVTPFSISLEELFHQYIRARES